MKWRGRGKRKIPNYIRLALHLREFNTGPSEMAQPPKTKPMMDGKTFFAYVLLAFVAGYVVGSIRNAGPIPAPYQQEVHLGRN